MPQSAWNAKRERQYEHVKESEKRQGRSTKRAKEIAARTVNKERARSGETKGRPSRTSTRDMSSYQRGGLRYGMHVIDRQDNFTLVGADARRGKLTLFDAEGPREPGAFKHVALRVSKLPEGVDTEAELGEAIRIKLVETETD